MPNSSEAIWMRARTTPESVALLGAESRWSYRELYEQVATFAACLDRYGVRPGDRVLLVAPTVPEFVAAYYGIQAAGAVAVTANTMSTSPELEYIGEDAGAVLVLGWEKVGPAPSLAAGTLAVPYWPLTTGLTGLADGDLLDAPRHLGDTSIAALLYTSGTTGRPKGVQLTHDNLNACASIVREAHEITAADRGATALPLFHVFGQVSVMNTAIQAGASLSLLERFEPEAMLAMLRRDTPTFMAGVPTMWKALLRTAGPGDATEFSGLRHAASGGASLPVEVMRAFEERFGCVIRESYGLTETSGAATFQTPCRPRKPGYVGRALPGCEITVRDDEGSPVPAGEVGEICVRGPVVMKGYWNHPEATAEALKGDLLRTGDLGFKDADGDVRIVDRKKDLVIRGGYNVYPREIEEVLHEHPDIVEAAVIGVPDEHYGEEVAAVIVLRPGGELDPETLRSWTKERLSAYKAPHLVAVVDELPRGATGKISKRAIDPDLFISHP